MWRPARRIGLHQFRASLHFYNGGDVSDFQHRGGLGDLIGFDLNSFGDGFSKAGFLDGHRVVGYKQIGKYISARAGGCCRFRNAIRFIGDSNPGVLDHRAGFICHGDTKSSV